MDFIEREREATSLWWYEVALVPGLLQTQTYAQGFIDNRIPPLDEETVEERIAARMERQEILTERKPPEGPDHERVAFMEGAFASELSADAGVVSRVTERLSMIRTRALDPDESARFIKRMVSQP
ncbi:Scr1 family TA system antitoxin-like transcriptional regulator [Streptomyces sp. RM72]|uniref:Scr1 family TA system antitoxin-like transcriptional regulator n=1 Tax=Streptomyces sp. RM72 TaxID=1115510 RepID=UPI0027E29A10|nr:Scr1 family TA system antitoxin-like transcriptional regulator [Streptomyces sp. RM72]